MSKSTSQVSRTQTKKKRMERLSGLFKIALKQTHESFPDTDPLELDDIEKCVAVAIGVAKL